MNKMKSLLGLFAMAAISTEENYSKPLNSSTIKKDSTIKSNPGQSEYWFREDGSFLNEKQGLKMLKGECVFKCFAINDKNALKKFNKFKSN